MEFLNWLATDKNWGYLVVTVIICGFVVVDIIRAARGKD